MRIINTGIQEFDTVIEHNDFYVDKTSFIKEWWENRDQVTLITRPRRFGKTFNMNMLKCFFFVEYVGRSDLFEGLDIWKDEKYRQLQGTYPVIFLSFADVKQNTYDEAKKAVISKSLQELSQFLENHSHKKVLILLDEYDTPLQEAYVNGYWDEMVSFMKSLFNSTFKTNPSLERALITGITRVSKESIF